MKFTKTLSGSYKSEDGKYEIRKYGGQWEVYNLQEKQNVYRAGKLAYVKNEKYEGGYYTLKEAKENIK